ncbi:MAG: D-2-hydroxyacid dehydrogenase [Gemmatimonas sp.]
MTQRIVVGANAHAELAAALLAARPGLEIRGARYTDISEADLEWGQCYIGFKRPPLPSMGNIAWVHCTGAGVDSWLDGATPHGALPSNILLTRTSESFGPRIAEWTISRALAFTQGIIPLYEAQRGRAWSPREPVLLSGSRVLIVGTGDIGTHAARLFKAFGCRVTGVSRTGGGDDAVFARCATVADLPGLVGDADWIVLAVPLTEATRGLFNRALLSRCAGATLINVGRGGVVEEAALPDALASGWLRGAALDVFETEPLPADSPLWSNERVIVSPHVSGLTTSEGVVRGFLECLDARSRGEMPAWTVNREIGY